ncbi:MAG: NAD(P)/FAD-dependent oxidoreductase [Vicinamibacterales bacterium]
MTTAIIGGGIMGVTLGYCLSKAGLPVTIYEASPTVGGLAGPLTLPDGTEVDRFYHAILSSDEHLMALCAELGIVDRLRFKPTGTLVYADGRLVSMSGLIDFLKFPPLRFVDRIRLGLTVVAANRVGDWQAIDRIPMRDWLVKHGGDEVFRRFWGPMLQAKFDGAVGDTPATWMWARLVRTRSTRKGVRQKEESGHLIGGYRTLLEAMAARIRDLGGAIHLSTPVSRIAIDGGRVRGVEVNGAVVPHDTAVVTMQAPIAARLVPEAPAEYRERLNGQRYLGIVCPLFVLDRPLTGVWTLNIADGDALVTGVIETTSYIDPSFVGGHHLVYVPKYVAPGSRWLQASDDEIRDAWTAALTRIVPGFSASAVRYCVVHRERFVEPLHGLGAGSHTIPMDAPVTGLHLVTTSQIYPALTNGESVTRHAREAAERLVARSRP